MAAYSLQDAQEQFDKELREVVASRKKPTILVFGFTGVGKTSLVRVILGKESVPDDAIAHGKPGTGHFIEYKTEFITLYSSL
jgi:predicted GTPase